MRARALDKKDVVYIAKHPNMSNTELAKKLKVRPALIGTYKTRMRKLGMELPRNIVPSGHENTMEALKGILQEEKLIPQTDNTEKELSEEEEKIVDSCTGGVDLGQEGGDKQVETIIEPEEPQEEAVEEEQFVDEGEEEELEEIPY